MVKRISTVAQLAAHVQQLANAFDVILHTPTEMRPEQGVAVHLGAKGSQERVQIVIISPVVDEVTYAVAMHELGHCLHPTGSVQNISDAETERLRVTMETAAWEWAEHYSLDWTPTMEHVRQLALQSYIDRERLIRRQQQERKELEERVKQSIRTFVRKLGL